MGKKRGSWQFPAHYRKARNCQESLFGIFWKLLAKFWKWHKFLAIPSSLYIGKKLPGTTCILKLQPLPGNFYPIYRELGIDRMWLHFMDLTGTHFHGDSRSCRFPAHKIVLWKILRKISREFILLAFNCTFFGEIVTYCGIFYLPPQAENAALAGRITLIGESSRLERAARCALM